MKKYEIGDIRITCADNTFLLKKSRYMNKFLVYNSPKIGEEEIQFEVCVDDLKKHCTGKLLQKNGLLELYQTGKGMFLVNHWTTCRFAYGFYMDDLERGSGVTC